MNLNPFSTRVRRERFWKIVKLLFMIFVAVWVTIKIMYSTNIPDEPLDY